ncbi:MAG: DUF1572 family protein [Ignavibacteriales bacterium]|nr:DUF1572 family protein [Ignavibacteriales bacterium]
MSIEQAYREDCILQFRKLKAQAERAIGQIRDEHFFATLDPDSNSIAIIMKHLAGNMRSRWTDFLTSDGEKPNRKRDSEFKLALGDTREKIHEAWEDGWERLFTAVSTLKPEDLGRTVTIRGEAHAVLEALQSQLRHYAVHVGQIVLLAKHYTGPKWETLSIPRAKSTGGL